MATRKLRFYRWHKCLRPLLPNTSHVGSWQRFMVMYCISASPRCTFSAMHDVQSFLLVKQKKKKKTHTQKKKRWLTRESDITHFGSGCEGTVAGMHISPRKCAGSARCAEGDSVFPLPLEIRHVLIHTDNETAAAYIKRHGPARSAPLLRIARQLLLWVQTGRSQRSSLTAHGELFSLLSFSILFCAGLLLCITMGSASHSSRC